MGKAIVLIFFVIGFIIFAAMKAAGKGLKQAYKAVNNEPIDLRNDYQRRSGNLSKVAGVIHNQLYIQFGAAGFVLNQDDTVPPSDDFVIGYIAGFSNQYLESMTMNITKEEGGEVVREIFNVIYDHDTAFNLLLHLTNSQGNQSKLMKKGIIEGRVDAHSAIEAIGDENSALPNGLYEYLQENFGVKKKRKKRISKAKK